MGLADLNECAQNNGGCSHTCTNTEGSYVCSCNVGYELDTDNHTCFDIDECVRNTNSCSHGCHNTPSSDDNECQDGEHDCLEEMNKECKNTPGSFECVSTDGYQLNTSADTPTCERTGGSSSDSVNSAVIAGIAVSILVVVGLACFLLVVFLR